MNKRSILSAAAIVFAVIASGCRQEAVIETPAPELVSISPTSGYAGDEAVITGKNFSADVSGNDVFFGNTKAEVKEASATSLKVILPDNEPGKVEVKVSVGEKSAEGLSFTYIQRPAPAPIVTSITPSEGSEGDEVVISGSNFGTSADEILVIFGSRNAEIKSVADDKITVTVPAGSGDVAVLVSKGDDIADPVVFKYIVKRVITVTSITPELVTESDEIKIFGTGFPEDPSEMTVSVSGTPAVVTAATAEGIIISVPALAKGEHKVKIEAKGAAPAETAPFVYWSLPKYTVSTPFGTGTNKNANGTWNGAGLNTPEGLALASDGKMWITTRGGTASNNLSHSVASADLVTGEVTFLVEPAILGEVYPWGGGFDLSGDFHTGLKNQAAIGKLTKNGVWSTYKITGVTLDNPMNLVFDSKGYMYVADRNNKRIVVAYNGEMTTTFQLDCRANYVALDAKEENLIVGASGTTATDAWVIFKIEIATGDVKVIAGSRTKPLNTSYSNGEAGNTLTATIGNISGIVCDTDGYIYYNDNQLLCTQVLIPGVGGDYTRGVIKTIAGQAFKSGKADGDGLSEATFKAQGALLKVPDGSFYVADGSQHIIRKLTPEK